MPVRMLTTPAGHVGGGEHLAERDRPAAASVSHAMTTAVLPPTRPAPARLTSPSSDWSCGATMPTTPVGSGTVKLKYGPATGFARAEHLRDLVGPPRVPDPAVDGGVDASHRVGRPASASSASNCARRPSITSATRYSDLAAVERGLAPPSRPARRGRPSRRRAGPCARPARRTRAARPSSRRHLDTIARLRCAGTRRRCTACGALRTGRRSRSRPSAPRRPRGRAAPPSRPNPLSL